MVYREARTSDIQQLQLVRHCVKENVVTDPMQVTEYDYLKYLTIDGKGWVCEVGNKIVGFAIVDIKHHQVWALFIKPGIEAQVTITLHDTMLNWYFSKYAEGLSVVTEAHTSMVDFYSQQGWVHVAILETGAMQYEMKLADWQKYKAQPGK
jgi:hypothetical protein